MNLTQYYYTLRPSLVFVADPHEQYCHLRGGDNEIIPLHDISDQNLLSNLFHTLKRNETLSYSDLKKTLQESYLHDETLSTTLDSELNTLLVSLLESNLLFKTVHNQNLTPLQKLLIREGTFSDKLLRDLQNKKIIIATNKTHKINELAKLLAEYGLDTTIITTDEKSVIPKQADLIVAYDDFCNDQFFQTIHNLSQQSATPWFMLRQAGFNLAQIGPIFIPQETACYHCLTQRMDSQRNNPEHQRQFERSLSSDNNSSLDEICSPAATSFIFLQFIIEIIRYFQSTLLTFPTKTLVAKSRYFNIENLQVETENLLKLPSCPGCTSLINSSRETLIKS